MTHIFLSDSIKPIYIGPFNPDLLAKPSFPFGNIPAEALNPIGAAEPWLSRKVVGETIAKAGRQQGTSCGCKQPCKAEQTVRLEEADLWRA